MVIIENFKCNTYILSQKDTEVCLVFLFVAKLASTLCTIIRNKEKILKQLIIIFTFVHLLNYSLIQIRLNVKTVN